MAEARLSLVLSMARELLDAIPRSASSSSSTDPHRRVKEDLKYLMRLLPRIKAMLRDAEKREARDESIKLWLTDLEEVAYDAEDVLDEYQYEVLRALVEGRAAAAGASRERKFVEVPSSLVTEVSIPDGMAERIREIGSRFDKISRDWEVLRLREEDRERRARATYPPPTSHLVDESAVYGREHDKKELIDLLLSENKQNTLSVVPVVGTGGIGKTTLAQLVCNNPSVVKHFDNMGWVCVSEDFDVVRLTKAIIESITKLPCHFTELGLLHEMLVKALNEKRTLLVLDDVWNEQRCYWESLRAPFLSCSGAVSIIVTTRNLSVAEIMQTVPPYRPGYLSEDQCELLFQCHAFRGRDPGEYPTLVEIGKQIVRRCRGLPLAVKTLAGLLQCESDEDSWENILQSDLCELHNDEDYGILAALRLSYNWMPVRLKPCFQFLSMYPKDHRYEKDEVVQLWIANGYIQPRGSMTMEDVGKEYIDDLLKRSIIEADWGDNDFFLMHDMVHALARSISKERCLSIDFGEKLCDRSDRVQHLYVRYRDYNETKDSPCQNRTVLRTLLAPVDFYEMRGLSMLQWTIRLRALHLECHKESDELPDSIGCLKHLRYLSIFSRTLRRLPDSICLLYNLQILKLNTRQLEELPRDMGNLINLNYIDVDGDFDRLPESICRLENLHTLACHHIRELPVGIGDLKNLRYLFLVNDDGGEEMEDCYSILIPSGFGKLTNLRMLDGFFSARTKMQGGIGIGELKDLANIEGKLGITGLERIDDILHAKDANLKSKHGLKELILAWETGRTTVDEQMEEMVLESLQPHPNLTCLRIVHYGGARFPSWLGDPSFSKLKNVSLFQDMNQKTMVNLPSLGQLPSLVSLTIEGRFEIPRKVNFPFLMELNFNSVDGLEEWGSIANDGFPCLRQLQIVSCPNLMKLVTVPSLQDITISCCESLTSLILCNGHPSMLVRLEIRHCSHLTSVVGLHKLDSLAELDIGRCPLLQVPQELPPTLRNVRINHTCKLTSLILCNGHPSMLRTVQIEDCSQLTSVVGLHKLDHLEELSIIDCHELWLLLEKPLPPKLRAVFIVRCWKLTSLAGLQGLNSLESLHLEQCPKLQLHPKDCLQSVPDKVDIIDCPRLMEWCKAHQFRYIQKILAQEALTISDIRDIPSDPKVENTSSLKYLCIKGACGPLPAVTTVWLPSTLETLRFFCCDLEGSLYLHQNLSILKRLKIESCKYLDSVVGLSKLHSLEELEIGNCRRLQLPQKEPLPPKLQALRISHSWELTSLTGLQDLTSLRSLYLNGCPKLQFYPNERLRSMLDEVEIIDCPRLMEWCKTHFTYIQDYF